MRRWVFCLGFWGALLLLWGQPPVELRVQPLLGDSPAANGAFPLAVQLESRSGNYQGALSVIVGGFGYRREYQYAVDLPAGSRKVIIATPMVGRYSEQATVRFSARGVNLEVRQPIRNILETDQLAVLVGDAIGGLSVLERVKTIENPTMQDYSTRRALHGNYKVAYCRPELFPEQAIALSGAQLIVLGAGAERLRAEQWNALRQWMMLGGVLVAPGGAGAVYLQTPALRELLPVEPSGTRTVSQLRALANWTGVRPPTGAATITQATLKSGSVLLAQDGAPLIAVRPYGLGAILFLAFNPFDAPLREYDARTLFWQRLLNQTATFAPSFTIASIHQNQGDYTYDRWGQPSITAGMELKPPSVALIVVLLGVYFLLVVPVNYWTLKRLRALDWAWVVTPLIALAFVGVLWRLAGDLYRKSLSSKVQTLIVAQSGSPDAYAINSALFFFPRAGLFDLQFDQSDLVEAGISEDYGIGGGSVPTVRTVQGEPTRVEGYRVSNLSFQWFRYTRSVQLQGAVEGVLRVERRNGRTLLSGKLRNRLPYTLTEARLYTPLGEIAISELPARQSVDIRQKPLQPLRTHSLSEWDGYGMPTLSLETLLTSMLKQREYKGMAFLTAQASEPVLTPELSAAAEQSAQVTYLISLPLEGVP
ncbi:MAG: hypothetical protein NZM28_03150 [Fimbriimonadales bacterium]|nr:hypothetical protein [Fimbriimonadales bacterium]